MLYTDDLVMIAETEDDRLKRVNNWMNKVENRRMRVNMNKAKVMISGERQKVMQKAVRWPCVVCGRGIGDNSNSALMVRSGYAGNAWYKG